MEQNKAAYRGCLLGLAIGDAMGYTIDGLSWDQIRENYGPDGLLGYDLQDTEFAPITSYTQIAAYLCNGLLLSVSRGKKDYVNYGKLALKEWVRSQQFYRDPEGSYCWITKLPQFRHRHCRDTRMLDNLRMDFYGIAPPSKNFNETPGAITTAVSAGLFYLPDRMAPEQIGSLTADLIALTHASAEVILCGVVLAYAITGIFQEPEQPLSTQFLQAIAVMDGLFRNHYPQSEALAAKLRRTVRAGSSPVADPQEYMEHLECADAPQCLAGAMFACLQRPEDFDSAIVLAVNHSGLSATVGAITGAILGAKQGESALPEFYLESLDCTEALGILAEDIACGTPAMGLFDDAWDHKYMQGFPPEREI